MNEDKLLQELLDDLEDEPEADDEPERAKEIRLMLELRKGETPDQGRARVALTPEYHAADSIFQLNQVTAFREADPTMLAKHLESQTLKIRNGDLGQVDAMLSAHASTLDALFHNLLLRSALNARDNFDVGEKLMKLALKAQSQCATALTKLAEIRNPKAYLSQTNIGLNQQINNGHMEEEKLKRAKSKPDLKNEILEKTDGERLDFGKAKTPVTSDQELETVAK